MWYTLLLTFTLVSYVQANELSIKDDALIKILQAGNASNLAEKVIKVDTNSTYRYEKKNPKPINNILYVDYDLLRASDTEFISTLKLVKLISTGNATVEVENTFMDEILNTAPMKALLEGIKINGSDGATDEVKKSEVKQFWLAKKTGGRSRLANIFYVADAKGATNRQTPWMSFAMAESCGYIDIFGHNEHMTCGKKVITYHSKDSGRNQEKMRRNTMMLGTTVAQEAALRTLGMITKTEHKFDFNGCMVTMRCNGRKCMIKLDMGKAKGGKGKGRQGKDRKEKGRKGKERKVKGIQDKERKAKGRKGKQEKGN